MPRHALFDFRHPVDDDLESVETAVRIVSSGGGPRDEQKPSVGVDVVGGVVGGAGEIEHIRKQGGGFPGREFGPAAHLDRKNLRLTSIIELTPVGGPYGFDAPTGRDAVARAWFRKRRDVDLVRPRLVRLVSKSLPLRMEARVAFVEG